MKRVFIAAMLVFVLGPTISHAEVQELAPMNCEAPGGNGPCGTESKRKRLAVVWANLQLGCARDDRLWCIAEKDLDYSIIVKARDMEICMTIYYLWTGTPIWVPPQEAINAEALWSSQQGMSQICAVPIPNCGGGGRF